MVASSKSRLYSSIDVEQSNQAHVRHRVEFCSRRAHSQLCSIFSSVPKLMAFLGIEYEFFLLKADGGNDDTKNELVVCTRRNIMKRTDDVHFVYHVSIRLHLTLNTDFIKLGPQSRRQIGLSWIVNGCHTDDKQTYRIHRLPPAGTHPSSCFRQKLCPVQYVQREKRRWVGLTLFRAGIESIGICGLCWPEGMDPIVLFSLIISTSSCRPIKEPSVGLQGHAQESDVMVVCRTSVSRVLRLQTREWKCVQPETGVRTYVVKKEVANTSSRVFSIIIGCKEWYKRFGYTKKKPRYTTGEG